jgi:hypothetical protein
MNQTSILSVDLDWIQHWSQERQVLDLCLSNFQNADKIIFIKAHHHILNYFIEGEKYSIDNIDHHHDINYDQKDGYHYNWFREGNWIYYLLTRKMLNRYHWVHNHNSLYGSHQAELMRDIPEYNFSTDINTMHNKNYNWIVICESFDYQQTSNFYEQLKMICNEYHKDKLIIDNTKNITSHIWKE